MNQAISTRSIRANGINFTYREAGSGPLVLCIHGFPDTAESFDEVLTQLASMGYRAVAPFTRGIAPTEAPADDDYSVLTLGRDVLALITALGAERATLIGHDWGAGAAYAAAALEPSRIERLVTLAVPPPKINRLTPAWLAMALFFQVTPLATRALSAGHGAAIDFIYRAVSPGWHFGPEATAPFKAVLAAPGGARSAIGTYRSIVRGMVSGARKASAGVLLKKIEVPTMIVLGAADPTNRGAPLERMGDAFAAPYELVMLEGAGHFPHREKPEAFAKHLERFLGPTPR